MSLSRKRKKELRKLQKQANSLWETQQVLVGEAASVAREASRQLGNFGREQVEPQVQAGYEKYAAPYVDKGKKVVEQHGRPRSRRRGRLRAVGVGCRERHARAPGRRSRTARRRRTARRPTSTRRPPVPLGPPRARRAQKKGIGAGGVIAIILGVAAAVGVLYAAWQTLRADDELWVADDPLRAPDA